MSEFTDFLVELFEPFGPVSARRMFGGHGIFHDGLMIGLVADEMLYLKADAQNAPRFEERDLPPFEYNKAGKTMAMSYFQAPEEIYDNPQMAADWARQAYEAALRSRPAPKARKPVGKSGAKPGTKRTSKSATQAQNNRQKKT